MATPREVSEAFVDESGWPRAVPVSRSQCSVWMADPSLEVRGALFHFLRERADTSRVETPFTAEELFPFITKYFEDCLAAPEEVADGTKWILGSIDLTHAIAYWASDFWKQQRGPDSVRSHLISWLRSVLLRFPQHRQLLATALADHLFFQKRVRANTLWRGLLIQTSRPCFLNSMRLKQPNPRLKTDGENARLEARFLRHGLAAIR